MNNWEKAKKLEKIVSKHVAISNFMRLVDGDLTGIGDALCDGRAVASCGNIAEPASLSFDSGADIYTIVKPMCKLGGLEFPLPEGISPNLGSKYYSPNVANKEDLFFYTRWSGGAIDFTRLNAGVIHLSREGAIMHAEALIAATKQAVEAARDD